MPLWNIGAKIPIVARGSMRQGLCKKSQFLSRSSNRFQQRTKLGTQASRLDSRKAVLLESVSHFKVHVHVKFLRLPVSRVLSPRKNSDTSIHLHAILRTNLCTSMRVCVRILLCPSIHVALGTCMHRDVSVSVVRRRGLAVVDLCFALPRSKR